MKKRFFLRMFFILCGSLLFCEPDIDEILSMVQFTIPLTELTFRDMHSILFNSASSHKVSRIDYAYNSDGSRIIVESKKEADVHEHRAYILYKDSTLYGRGEYRIGRAKDGSFTAEYPELWQKHKTETGFDIKVYDTERKIYLTGNDYYETVAIKNGIEVYQKDKTNSDERYPRYRITFTDGIYHIDRHKQDAGFEHIYDLSFTSEGVTLLRYGSNDTCNTIYFYNRCGVLMEEKRASGRTEKKYTCENGYGYRLDVDIWDEKISILPQKILRRVDKDGYLVLEQELDCDIGYEIVVLPCDEYGKVLATIDDIAQPLEQTKEAFYASASENAKLQKEIEALREKTQLIVDKQFKQEKEKAEAAEVARRKQNEPAVLKYRALILIGIGVLVILLIVLVLLRKRKKK